MIAQIRKNKKGGKWRAIFYSLLLLVTLSLTSGYLFYSNWQVLKRRTALKAQIGGLDKELEELEQKNSDLKAGISRPDDPNYLEEVAREKLSLKKPGEQVVVVLPPAGGEGQPETTAEQKTFFEQVWESAKNKVNEILTNLLK